MPNVAFTGPTWGRNTLTWSYARSNSGTNAETAFSSFLSGRYEADVERALARWESVSGVDFVRVEDRADRVADIRIGFGQLDGNAIGEAAYSSIGGTLQPGVVVRMEDPKPATYKIGPNGNLVFAGYTANFYQVVLHEIGHAMGLDHSSDPSAALHDTAGGARNTDLNANDIAAARTLFGSRPGMTSDVSTGYTVLLWQGKAEVRDVATGDLATVLSSTAPRLSFVGGNTYALSLDDARTLGLDPAKLRDYDGNDLGGAGGWRLNGLAVVRTDGALSYVLTNAEIGRWAEVTPRPGGGFNLANHGANGDARVVGNYLDPLVALGVVERGSAVDSQVRFAADLRANRLQVLGAGDFDRDGAIDLFWKQPDGNADPSNDIYLRAILHADGNIQYANYLNNDQFRGYMASAQVPHAVYDSWLKVS